MDGNVSYSQLIVGLEVSLQCPFDFKKPACDSFHLFYRKLKICPSIIFLITKMKTTIYFVQHHANNSTER